MKADDESRNEYEREPVPEKARFGQGKFWGMYAGEHAAGTEFMIGPLFLQAGASLQDLLLGLLLGNLLAVLTWRYLVAPIAVARRLTLYYQLERIAGGSLVKFYNLVNGLLFCGLAGAMITVSASAVGVPFGVKFAAAETAFGFGTPAFSLIVALVGVIIAVVAAGGYRVVAQVSNYAAPFLIFIFAASGIVALKQMDSLNWEVLLEGKFWSDAVAFVQEREGEKPFGFWQIVAFAWLCNGAMHFGMSDLTIFRFARNREAGWAPASGMFLGHYLAWIAAGLLLAAQIKLSQDHSANPGALAWGALGWLGIVCVVVAGWTTANPTIYRAGLAFQGIFPKTSRLRMTLLAGAVATFAGLFPNLTVYLLGFVGTYGTILGPMGAVIFVDHHLSKRFDFRREYALKHGITLSVPALVAWLLPVCVGLYLIFQQGVFAAYCVIPAWFACGALYVALIRATQGSEASRERNHS